ncbi:PREDICTED: mitotic spindle checkpoint protein BUBR1-like [Brassica oleracea var. oleracea]|uniref:BUB1 N-terminal domain-containing protein n=1 Tax=Brassica oleracea var. oleracea TaxID=109376 RepID=A0A0D3CJD1_BRAOL|nr:PREDICTED: mitotic spindle checkpoint protein BUBR1-like [Brassica oleracea var. oleracea]
MGAGGVSSGWRVLGSVGDIRAVREKFWHSDRYKDDLRYLKFTRGKWFILLKAEHCADAEVIYKFLDVNDIGRTHGLYYRDYGLNMEYKGKVKTANEIFNLRISRNAKPVEKLNDAYKKFMVRTMRRTKTVDDIRSFFCKFIYA